MSNAVTLEMLLSSRDSRSQKQKNLLKNNPGTTLVCMTVVIPGSVKRNSDSLLIAKAGVAALKDEFDGHILLLEECDLETGYEVYLLTDLPNEKAKQMSIEIEESHPLGRLLDLDVFDSNGAPIQREQLGFEPRKCLICNQPARYCMRNRSHSRQEIEHAITKMTESYVHRV